MLKIGKLLKNRSIFLTFLVSYLLMLVIPIAIVGSSYSLYTNVVKKQMENYNVAMLQQAQKVLDERMHGMERLMLNVGLEPVVQKFLYTGAAMDGNDKYNMSRIIELLSKYKSTDSFIDNMYIYFRNSDIILTNRTKFTPEVFYNDESRYSQWKLQDWQHMLAGNYYMECKPVQAVMTSAGAGHFMTVWQSLPIGPEDKSLAVLVMSINSSRMEELLKDINILDKGAVFIADGRNRTILGMGNAEILESIKYEDLSFGSEYTYKRIAGRETIISGVSSSFGGWKYVSVIPTTLFTDEINKIRNIIIGITLLILLAGVVLALVLARRNVSPIRRIAGKLREKLQVDPSQLRAGNEMDFIDLATSTTLKENQHIKEAMHRQLPVLRSNLLLQLIHGNAAAEENIRETLDSFDVKFKHDYFCVLLVAVDKYNDNSLKERNLTKFVIGNVMEQLGNEKGPAYMVDMDLDRLAMVVNVPEAHDAARKDMEHIAKATLDFMRDKFSTVLSIALGGIHKKIDGIGLSYREALKTIEYQMLQCQGRICAFDEIAGIGQAYAYPLETEIQLINSIKVGNAKRVQEMLDRLFEQNFKEGGLSMELARCLFFDIMSTAVKVLGSGDLDCGKVFGEGFEPYEKITSCRNIDEMQQVLKTVFGEICRFINANKKNRNSALVDSILSYIRKHYAENNLSLVSVADAFHINPNYLSGHFKEQTGENFVNYINTVRIDKAKALLKETDHSVQEIAETVGYSNSGVLIRNFKKYEGITPGEYRENGSGPSLASK